MTGMGPRVVGIDLSLTSTGLADNWGATRRVRTKPGSHLQRIRAVTAEVLAFTDPAELVVLEGPSYHSNGAGTHTRAGLWWLLVDHLDKRNTTLLVVSPAQRAMYATGRGNASKDEVLIHAVKRYPGYDVAGNDIADALVLTAIGARLIHHPIDPQMPLTHMRALDKLHTTRPIDHTPGI